jgi:hypothetical protein
MSVRTERRSSMDSEPRSSAAEQVASAATTSVHTPAGLDWQAFSAAYFPGRRRHDLEALTAYGAYRRSRTVGTGSSAEPGGIETRPGARAATALRDWEDEGGATLSPDGP